MHWLFSISLYYFLSLAKISVQQNCPCLQNTCYNQPCCPNSCSCGVSCPFNSACSCYLPNATCYDSCSGATPSVFPTFVTYNISPISQLCFYGTFSSIYDNSLYPLTTLTDSQICFQQTNKVVQNLITYETSFSTINENGISGLTFIYYNPTNLSTMVNNKYLKSLTIQNAQLTEIPYSIFHFPSLSYLNLSKNKLTIVIARALQPTSLTSIDLSNNQIELLQDAAFNTSSLQTILLSNNNLTQLPSNPFDLDSLVHLDVSNNRIASVDSSGFSTWFKSSLGNSMNLTNNALPCDYSINWMATYVVCPRRQIIITQSDQCANGGGSIYNYLLPYAKCI